MTQKDKTTEVGDSEYPVPESWSGARCVFKGVRFDVCSLNMKVKSGHVQRDIVVHPGSVVMLPILDADHVLMIRNQRFVVGERLWELPAGTLEPPEPPLVAARRELVEETGYEAEEMTPLMEFYASPGFCTEKLYVFVASNLRFLGQRLEETENIEVEAVTWPKVLSMIEDGTIKDAKTIATLLRYRLAGHTVKGA